MIEEKIKIKDLQISYKYFGHSEASSEFSDRDGKSSSRKSGIFLILHGWGGSSDSWIKVCECLENNYYVYALDFPFFGKSGDLKKIWRVDDFVSLVEEFAENIILRHDNFYGYEKIGLIAHSFGGRVAIKIAAKNPKWIFRLFLCDAAGIKHAPTIIQKLARVGAKMWRKVLPQKIGSLDSPKNFLRKFFALLRTTAYKVIGASDYYKCKNDIMRETFKNIIAEDLTEYLDKIKIPTTIIWGEEDKYTPLSDGKLMDEKIQNSKLYVIKGVGHGAHLHTPGEVCRIIKSVADS
ncbi:MAG: alpha/beta hydrolase [bacterium]